MVNYNLIADIGIDEQDVESLVREALGEQAATGNMEGLLQEDIENFQRGNILKGKIVGKAGDDVVIDVGLKSEGLVSKSEFEHYDDLEVGDVIEVLLEELEDDTGAVRLSKRKADRIRGWEKILETKREDDVVEGKCMRKIKGGLLVDIGVPVFLPASQVDIRRPSDIGAYIGKMIRAVILKVDEERRNIVISRRRLIEKEREAAKNELLTSVKVGDTIKGSVTNIADFGAFVDLGGLDGLLHITDMSWGRVSHPSDRVKIGDEIEVRILSIDRDREKIALGLKQLEESPWDKIDAKYPIGSRVRGKVVNLVSYGAFVQLEEGIEGLVHISEMSWTRRVNHPSELVNGSRWASSRPRSTPGSSWPRSTRPAPSSRARSATSPTTGRSWRSSPASTACCTCRTSPGRRRSLTRTRSSRRATPSSAWCSTSTRTSSGSGWA
jgi:small subunit ribosomal protein S1